MLRIPNQTFYSATVVTTLTQSATFLLPAYDVNGLVAKVVVATLSSGNASFGLNVFIQSTDDGGTTWYDCVNIGTMTGIVTTAAARWAKIPVNFGLGAYVASASDATLGAGTMGVPIMSPVVRVKYAFTNMTDTSTATVHLKVYANDQSQYA